MNVSFRSDTLSDDPDLRAAEAWHAVGLRSPAEIRDLVETRAQMHSLLPSDPTYSDFFRPRCPPAP
ncbi:hypothetical protein SAMN02800687_0432 [Curtobacterium sp. UNCCL20]|nr:hypothetical protein SAMN02800687_0432 [Curtobacterium sp. UNCCL20]